MDTQCAIWGLNDGECCLLVCDAVCLKTNATSPSETSVTSHQITRRHIPEDSSLQWRSVFSARYELNSYMLLGRIPLFEGLNSLCKHLVTKMPFAARSLLSQSFFGVFEIQLRKVTICLIISVRPPTHSTLRIKQRYFHWMEFREMLYGTSIQICIHILILVTSKKSKTLCVKTYLHL